MDDTTREELRNIVFELVASVGSEPSYGEHTMGLIQSEITKAQEQLLDEVMEMKPLTTVDSLINLWCDRIEAKRKELNG